MSGGMYASLSFVLELGVPLAILYMPLRIFGGDAGRRQPAPEPVTPPTPEAVALAARPLPDCLVPRPLAAVREPEPV